MEKVQVWGLETSSAATVMRAPELEVQELIKFKMRYGGPNEPPQCWCAKPADSTRPAARATPRLGPGCPGAPPPRPSVATARRRRSCKKHTRRLWAGCCSTGGPTKAGSAAP